MKIMRLLAHLWAAMALSVVVSFWWNAISNPSSETTVGAILTALLVPFSLESWWDYARRKFE